ncbi:MAG: hypothetical protein AAF998_02830 [Bacteroidota bacterium]
MKNFKYNNVTIQATSQAEATQKMKAIVTLAAALDGRTLSALAQNGPAILNGPDGGMVRSYLGV